MISNTKEENRVLKLRELVCFGRRSMCLQREASLDELVVANFTDCFSLPDLEHEYNINCHFNTLQAALIPQLGLYQLE